MASARLSQPQQTTRKTAERASIGIRRKAGEVSQLKRTELAPHDSKEGWIPDQVVEE